MVIREAATELHGSGDGLKKHGQLLHGSYSRVVEFGGIVSTSVMVCELLGSGESDLAIAGVDLSGKIMGLRGKVKNTCMSARRELEFSMVSFAVFRVGGDFGHRLVLGMA